MIIISSKGCLLCPRHCSVDRKEGQQGFCRAGNEAKVALVGLHRWEEPCISGQNGAGTVFFANCNLRCVFCQNHVISDQCFGISVDEIRLAEIFLEQQQRNAECVELVTPTHYVYVIIKALKRALSAGLTIPVVYNTNAYEAVETIELLNEYVDVFLPDLKYFDDSAARRYSGAPEYFKHASAAIEAMFKIAGPAVMKDNMLKKGVLVRHLILPGLYKDSIEIVKWLWQTFGDDIYISLMNQYTPVHKATSFPEINRRVTTYEYQKVVEAALDLGVKNCFVQEKGSSSEAFIPAFNGENVLPADGLK